MTTVVKPIAQESEAQRDSISCVATALEKNNVAPRTLQSTDCLLIGHAPLEESAKEKEKRGKEKKKERNLEPKLQ
jgi:hypothetical protein